MKMNLQIDKV